MYRIFTRIGRGFLLKRRVRKSPCVLYAASQQKIHKNIQYYISFKREFYGLSNGVTLKFVSFNQMKLLRKNSIPFAKQVFFPLVSFVL